MVVVNEITTKFVVGKMALAYVFLRDQTYLTKLHISTKDSRWGSRVAG